MAWFTYNFKLFSNCVALLFAAGDQTPECSPSKLYIVN
jgi:hypothetical protein